MLYKKRVGMMLLVIAVAASTAILDSQPAEAADWRPVSCRVDAGFSIWTWMPFGTTIASAWAVNDRGQNVNIGQIGYCPNPYGCSGRLAYGGRFNHTYVSVQVAGTAYFTSPVYCDLFGRPALLNPPKSDLPLGIYTEVK